MAGGRARGRDLDAHPGKRAGRARRAAGAMRERSPVRRGRRLLARAGHATSFRGGTVSYRHGKRRRELQARRSVARLTRKLV